MTYADNFNLRATNLNFNNVADAIDGVLSRPWGGTSSGSGTAYTVTCSPAWTSYQTGDVLIFTPHTTGTGAATVNVNSLGTKTIRRKNRALAGGELTQNVEAIMVYDGTFFELLNHGGAWVSWTPTITGVSPMTVSVGTLHAALYKADGDEVFIELRATITTSGTASNRIRFTLPVTGETGEPFLFAYALNTVGLAINSGTAGSFDIYRSDLANHPLTTDGIRVSGSYRRA